MNFLFSSASKQVPLPHSHNSITPSLENKKLKQRLQELAEENQRIKERLDEQKQSAIYTKKLLGFLFANL